MEERRNAGAYKVIPVRPKEVNEILESLKDEASMVLDDDYSDPIRGLALSASDIYELLEYIEQLEKGEI